MKRFRVTIAGLMGWVVLIALTIAAFREPGTEWASLIVSLALATLGVMTLGALFGSPDRRPGRAGFAIAGWGYMLLALTPIFGASTSFPPLITSVAVDAIGSYFGQSSALVLYRMPYPPPGTMPGPPAPPTVAEPPTPVAAVPTPLVPAPTLPMLDPSNDSRPSNSAVPDPSATAPSPPILADPTLTPPTPIIMPPGPSATDQAEAQLQTAHGVFALVVGALGGWVAAGFAARRKRAEVADEGSKNINPSAP